MQWCQKFTYGIKIFFYYFNDLFRQNRVENICRTRHFSAIVHIMKLIIGFLETTKILIHATTVHSGYVCPDKSCQYNKLHNSFVWERPNVMQLSSIVNITLQM